MHHTGGEHLLTLIDLKTKFETLIEQNKRMRPTVHIELFTPNLGIKSKEIGAGTVLKVFYKLFYLFIIS